MPHSV